MQQIAYYEYRSTAPEGALGVGPFFPFIFETEEEANDFATWLSCNFNYRERESVAIGLTIVVSSGNYRFLFFRN